MYFGSYKADVMLPDVLMLYHSAMQFIITDVICYIFTTLATIFFRSRCYRFAPTQQLCFDTLTIIFHP